MPMFRRTISSVVKDPRVLDFSFVPDHLPNRERQMERISALFSPILDHPVSQNAFFHGPVGTGKTSLAHRFCLDFIKEAEGQKGIDYILVNCRDKNTSSKAVREIVKKYQAVLPKGYPISELLEILRKDLRKRDLHLVVVLDEVDILVGTSGSEVIYHLTRFDEEKADVSGSLSLIIISTKRVLDQLDPATTSTFKRTNIVEFGRYTKDELLDIIEQRVELGLHPGTITDEGKEMIAGIAAEQGDARRAIELLQVSAAYADEDGERGIALEHIRKAKSQVAKVDVEGHLATLDVQRKLALLGIARALRREMSVTMGDAKKNYQVACEEVGKRPRSHTQYWKYVKDLSIRGIIDTSPSGKGRQGSTTMISLNELPVETIIDVLEKELL